VESLGFASETKRIAMDLHINDYAIIEFPEPDFDAGVECIKKALALQFALDQWR
jgi:hypothetical protein